MMDVKAKAAKIKLLLMDVDRFKSINDKHGHPAGDKVLKALGQLLGSAARSQDLAARFAIRSIPTLALFRGGREVARQSGAMDAGRLVAWVQSQTRPG